MESQAFKVYTIDHGAIQSAEVKDTEGQGHGALAGMLKDWVTAAGIDIYAGCTGAADDAVRALLAGELTQNDTPTCDHHHGVHTCHA